MILVIFAAVLLGGWAFYHAVGFIFDRIDRFMLEREATGDLLAEVARDRRNQLIGAEREELDMLLDQWETRR